MKTVVIRSEHFRWIAFLSVIFLTLIGNVAVAQTTQPIRNQFTTNNAMNAPSDGWIPIWNNVAKRWSNGVNTASATNNAQPPSATLSNLTATGVSPGATNASAYISSSTGKGTNVTLYSATTVVGAQTNVSTLDVTGAVKGWGGFSSVDSGFLSTDGADYVTLTAASAALDVSMNPFNISWMGNTIVSMSTNLTLFNSNVTVAGNFAVGGTVASSLTNGISIGSTLRYGIFESGGFFQIYDLISGVTVFNSETATRSTTIGDALAGGSVTIPVGMNLSGLTANRALVLNSSKDVTNATGTADNTTFLRGDGVYAVPSGSGGGGAGSLPFNLNQFDTNVTASIKDGAVLTNVSVRGMTLPTLTASRPLVLNSSGNPTNATGTPDGTKFLRDDGTLAVPAGTGGSGTNFASAIITNDLQRAVLWSTATNLTASWNGPSEIIWAPTGVTASLAVTGTPGNGTNAQVINVKLRLTDSGTTSVTFPTNGIDGLAPFVLTAPSTNEFALIYDGQTFRIASYQSPSTGSGQVLVVNTNPVIYTPTVRYVPTAITGVGGANTNFTLLSTQPEVYINGFTNVSLRAVMGYDAALVDYWTCIITNGSGSARTLEFSAVTNNWRFNGVYGTNAPSTLTNATRLEISGRSHGTNVQVVYSYTPWP